MNTPTTLYTGKFLRLRSIGRWEYVERVNATGGVSGGTGGVCYLYFPAKPSPRQRRALAAVGVA